IWGDRCDGWYLVNRQNMLIIHEKMPPKTSEKRHFHSISRQFFFVLEGVLTMELEGEKYEIGAQQGIEIPPESKHQARNDTESTLEFMVISHPTTRGDRTDLTE
ncbi:cupin, partial [bacteria symbiont BFo2 of Frankliniella occidentalis]